MGNYCGYSAARYETKMAILKKRAELEHLDINQEVMQYVATNINSNIRELEGALNKNLCFRQPRKRSQLP